jgi:excisionase family DNA binding protein
VTPPVTPLGHSHSDLPVLYTTEEAADILRVRQGWLERQAAARKIPFTLLGGCYRFTVRHLHEIVSLFEPESGVTRARRAPLSQRANSSARAVSPLQAKPRTRAA